MASSPPIVQNTVGRSPVTNLRAPTTSITNAATSWRGLPPVVTVPVPQLPGLLWQGKSQGTFSLIEAVPSTDVRFARGPRISPKKGTVSVWAPLPAAGSARTMFLLGSGVVTFATATLVVGISTTNRATAIIRDFGGAVVASIDASTLPALPPGALAEFKLSWDAGLGLVAMSVNGVAVPPGDFITDPGGTPWVPGVPTVAVLDKGSLSQPITLSQISADYLL